MNEYLTFDLFPGLEKTSEIPVDPKNLRIYFAV